jgi:hypothetical protein
MPSMPTAADFDDDFFASLIADYIALFSHDR